MYTPNIDKFWGKGNWGGSWTPSPIKNGTGWSWSPEENLHTMSSSSGKSLSPAAKFANRFKKFAKRDIIQDLEKTYKNKDKDFGKGLLGNYIMRKLTPDNLDIDLLSNTIGYNKDNFGFSFGQQGKNSSLNLNWRF